MINKILEFMKQAGEVAKKTQEEMDIFSEVFQKDSNISNVVTQADLEISDLFEKFVRENFSHLDYIIVDEEKLSSLGNNPLEKIEKAEYSFVIDPIDGTQPYSLKMSEYGISVGILRYGKPYLGAIYCPFLNEAIYIDETNTYLLQNAFMKEEKKVALSKTKTLSRSIIFDMPWNVMINSQADFSKETVMCLYSIVVHILYIATGRGKATFFGVYLWDIAGGWPILKNLGFEIINYNSEKIMETISGKNFDKALKTKELHIICRPQDFKHLKSITTLR